MKGNFILGWKDLVFRFIPAASYQFACPPQPTIAIHILGPPPQPCPPPVPGSNPFPSPAPVFFAYSGTPSCFLFFHQAPHSLSTPCDPDSVQQILRKVRPALAQPQPPGGGRGRAGRCSRSRALPV